MTLRFPVPSPLHEQNLASEIAAVTGGVSFWIEGAELVVVVPEGTDPATIEAIVNAHTGLLTPEQEADAAAEAEADQSLRDLEPILAKCRAVLAGTDTFTNAQAQRLIAGLTLVVYRRLKR